MAILYTYNPINLFVARALLLWGIRFSDIVVFFLLLLFTTFYPQLLGSSSCPDGLWFEPSTGLCAPPDEVSFTCFLSKD